jgi:hypothetical protein
MSKPIALLAGLLVPLLLPGPTLADPMEIDFTCGCEKKSDKVKLTCQGSGSPTVTVKSSTGGKDEACEAAGRTLCYRAFGESCPQHSCLAKVSKTGERTLTKEAEEKKSRPRRRGSRTHTPTGSPSSRRTTASPSSCARPTRRAFPTRTKTPRAIGPNRSP